MKNSVLLIAVILLVGSGFYPVFAQEKVNFVDPDWGNNQLTQERIKYWEMMERRGPDTNIVEARARAYKEFTSMHRPKTFLTQSTPAWEQVGGSQDGYVSGRPTGIAFDKQHPSTCYLATSGGGVWKSTDLGNNWVNVSGSFSSYAMGGIAVDYTDGNIIYAGTGDLYDRTGDGLYKSYDGGLNWTRVATSAKVSTRIYQVVLDPVTPTTVYITTGSDLRKSIDGGTTWKTITSTGTTTHLVIDPNDPSRLYVGGGVIKRSTDGGTTWSGDLAANIGSKSTITLAISAKNSSRIFASIGSNSTGGSVGVARSDDSGSTWNLLWSAENYLGQQAFYDNACAVSPYNPDYVSVGGLDIYRSTNGGLSFTQATDWRVTAGRADYTHADIHVLQYGTSGLWCLSDGGLFLSSDNAKNWIANRNTSLSTMLFVGGDADPDFTYVVGGAQDNGVNKATTVSTSKLFRQKLGGDGGRCFVSQTDGLTVYSTYINASLQKSPDGGESWNIGPHSTSPNNILPNGGLYNEGAPFYMTYDVCESDAAIVAMCGLTNVYYTDDGAGSVRAITKSSTLGSSPQSVHVPAADPSVVYVGAGSGTYVTKDLGVIWKKSTKSIGTVADFTSDPGNAGIVWAAVAGFGSSHFARSTDYGTTWETPATNMPNIDASCITRAPNGNLFIGHTFGVLGSTDNGVTWFALRDGMPLTQVTKLRVRGSTTSYLLATTYGHGMYKLNVSDLPSIIQADVPKMTSTNEQKILSVSPNPVRNSGQFSVAFTNPRSGQVSMKLFDALGKEIKTLLNEYLEAGTHSSTITSPDISGIYWLVLTANGSTVTQKFISQ